MITSNGHTVEQKPVTKIAIELGFCFGFGVLPALEYNN